MSRRRIWFVAGALAWIAAGCSSSGGLPPQDAGTEEAADAGTDATLSRDAADTGTEAADATNPGDATDGTVSDSPVPDSAAEAESDGHAEAAPDAFTDGEASDADGTAPVCSAPCGPGEKMCASICVSVDDPQYGCTTIGCDVCGYGGSLITNFETLGCSAGACVIATCPPPVLPIATA